MASEELNAKYVYGVVDATQTNMFKAKGIYENEKGIYLVPFKDIAAVVSDANFEELDPTDENLLAHEIVLQEALLEKRMSVAPMRFCTVLGSKQDVEKLLQEGYYSFKKNLLKVKEKVEIGVKMFVDVKKMEQTFGGKTLKKSKDIAELFYAELKKMALQDCLNELATDDMIMNASFLVNMGEEERIRERLVELDKDFTEFVKVRLFGPSAPYNFVSMPKK